MRLKILLLILFPLSIFAEVNLTNWTTMGIDGYSGHSNIVGATKDAAQIVLTDKNASNQAQAALYQIDYYSQIVHMVGEKFNIPSINTPVSLVYDRTGTPYVAYDSGNNIRILKQNVHLKWETFADYPLNAANDSSIALKDFKIIISHATDTIYLAVSYVETSSSRRIPIDQLIKVTQSTSQLYLEVVARTTRDWGAKWNVISDTEMGSNLSLYHFSTALSNDKTSGDKLTMAYVNEKHMAEVYSSRSGLRQNISSTADADKDLFKVKDGTDRVYLGVMSNNEPMLSFVGDANKVVTSIYSNKSWDLYRHPTEDYTNISSPRWFFDKKDNAYIYSYIINDNSGYHYFTQIYNLDSRKWTDSKANPVSISHYNKDLGEVSYDEDNNKLLYLADETDGNAKKRIIIQWQSIIK